MGAVRGTTLRAALRDAAIRRLSEPSVSRWAMLGSLSGRVSGSARRSRCGRWVPADEAASSIPDLTFALWVLRLFFP